MEKATIPGALAERVGPAVNHSRRFGWPDVRRPAAGVVTLEPSGAQEADLSSLCEQVL